MQQSTPHGEPALIIGCGYLGRRIAACWLAAGRRVLATTRSRADELRALGIEPILCDVCSPVALPQAATVVYAVGYDRRSGAPMREVYVDGLERVLAVLPPGGRLINVSSTGVYGDTAGNWVDEESPPHPADESGRVVWEAEQLLRRQRPDAIVLRFAGIYGPGRLLRESAIRAGEPLATDPMQWLNLIHVDDGVTAILAAEKYANPGDLINVADGHPVRRGDFYRRLAELLHAPAPTFTVPKGERGDRRIGNERLIRRLQLTLKYPTYFEGLAASV